jgi:hypothetical protein
MKKLLYLLLLCLPMIGFGQGLVNCSLLEVTDVVIDNTNLTIDIAVYNGDTMDSHYPFIAYTIDALGDTIQNGMMNWFVTFASDTSWYNYGLLSPILPIYPISIYFVYSNLTGPNPGEYTCILSYGGITSIQEHSLKKELLKVTDLLGRETKQNNQPLFYIYDDGTVEKRIVID